MSVEEQQSYTLLWADAFSRFLNVAEPKCFRCTSITSIRKHTFCMCYIAFCNSLPVFPYVLFTFHYIYIFMKLCIHPICWKGNGKQESLICLASFGCPWANWKKYVFVWAVCQTCICCLNIYHRTVWNVKLILIKSPEKTFLLTRKELWMKNNFCQYWFWKFSHLRFFFISLFLFLWSLSKNFEIQFELGPLMSNSIMYLPKIWTSCLQLKFNKGQLFCRLMFVLGFYLCSHKICLFVCLDFADPNVILTS